MLRALTTFLFAALTCFSAQASTVFTITLQGSQEVPPVVSAAAGSGTAVLNDAQDQLTILLAFTGLDLDGTRTPGNTGDDVIGLHIHNAPAGANGGVVFGIINPNSDSNGDVVINNVGLFPSVSAQWDGVEGNGTTLADQLPNLLAGNLYVNVHTNNFPSGQIRGQLIPEPTAASLAALAGAGLLLRRRKAR